MSYLIRMDWNICTKEYDPLNHLTELEYGDDTA